jgi:two-component system sensor histidine kinase/response regulator
MTVVLEDADRRDPIDAAALLANFAGENELLREIVDLFLQECPERLAAMWRALAAGDRPALRLVAHSFKGSLDTLGARRAAAAAAVLERTARTGDLEVAADACAMLEEEIAHAAPALAVLAGAPCGTKGAACE